MARKIYAASAGIWKHAPTTFSVINTPPSLKRGSLGWREGGAEASVGWGGGEGGGGRKAPTYRARRQ